MIITFEDNGQPYLVWKVNLEGLIVECYPQHDFLWVGKYVYLPDTLRAGDHLQYSETEITVNHPPLKSLRHKIAGISKT
ncbi:MAG: hypothetical protein V4663_06095 [Bacteroidota bacterium]